MGDLGRAACRAVCVHQHDVHGAPVGAALVVLVGAHRQVRHAVAVQVQGRHGSPKVISMCQRGAAVCVAGDLGSAVHRAICVHQHDVHGARLLLVRRRVVPGGAGRQVRHAIPVDVAQERHGCSKVIKPGQDGAVFRVVVDLRGAQHELVDFVGVYRHDVYRAPVGAVRVVLVGAHRQVRHAVPVAVADGCQRYPEVVVVGEAQPVVCKVVDLKGALYRAVGIHQHDVYGAPVLAARVVQVGARRQVRHAVAVEVAHGCHGYPKVVAAGEAGAVCSGGVDLRGALYRAVGVHHHHMHGAPDRAFRVASPGGARRQVGDAVAVDIPSGCHGYPKVVAVGQVQPVLGGRVDLHRALYHAVGVYRAVAVHPAAAVHQHDMYGARVGTICPVVPGGARRQVRHAVAVQVAHKRHGYAKKVAVVQPGAVLRAVVDLRGVLYRAVGVHQHDVHGAPVGAARVVLAGARRQVRHAVAVQVAHKRHGPPKGVARRQVGSVPCRIADLRGAPYHAVAVHQHHVHGARVDAALAVVPGGPHRQVVRAVAVQVGHGRH